MAVKQNPKQSSHLLLGPCTSPRPTFFTFGLASRLLQLRHDALEDGESDKQSRDASDAAVIEAATEALAKGTEAFAAIRMNRGIQQALAGKNVQAL